MESIETPLEHKAYWPLYSHPSRKGKGGNNLGAGLGKQQPPGGGCMKIQFHIHWSYPKGVALLKVTSFINSKTSWGAAPSMDL